MRLFETNILSGVRLSRHYLAKMLLKKTGRILFILSEAAIAPSPEMPHYSATKTMQLSISRSVAELTKGTEVTVNTVMPGSNPLRGSGAVGEGSFSGALRRGSRSAFHARKPSNSAD